MEDTMISGGTVTTPQGFRAAGVTAGFKRSGAPDMALLVSDVPAHVAGAFTANAFAAAPVRYDREVLATGRPVRAVLVNSGNANACTGPGGDDDARAMAAYAAELLGVAPQEVLVSSTGRIGVPLPMEIIRRGTARAVEALDAAGGAAAAEAIMTTDTRPKSAAATCRIGGTAIHIGGMTKGAGMIAPALRLAPAQATMLCYLTTDAAIERAALEEALGLSLDRSFNRITVDGDTSTNDTVLLFANGLAGNPVIRRGTAAFETFRETLAQVASRLARDMVLDGEGVTRFVEVRVRGALSDADARACAETIANSVLCKTAWFGADPNWGRILCAAGYSGIDLDPTAVNLDYDEVPIVRNGMDAGTPEEKQVEAVSRPEFRVDLDLGLGAGSFTVWTCDLTYEYVKINADYHT